MILRRLPLALVAMAILVMAGCGFHLRKEAALPESMSPQAAVGSVTPRPRNESDASSRIACAMKAVSMIR